jgi:acetyl-CoA acetyltransferase
MTAPRVAGVGLTSFGEHSERTGRDMFAEAGLAAIDDAGVDPDDVEALYYGNFMGELAEHQGHQAPLMAEAAGLSCPATRYEEACASAGVAVREAARTIRSGEADVVLAGGVESMTRVPLRSNTEVSGDPYGPWKRQRFRQVNLGEAAELIAERWDLSRRALDKFSYQSHERAARAAEEGRFDRELLPVPVQFLTRDSVETNGMLPLLQPGDFESEDEE